MRASFFTSAILIGGLSSLSGTAIAQTISQNRDLPAFSKLAINGSIDADITVGQAQSVTIRADESEVDRIETRVEGDTLIIKMKGNFRKSRDMLATITVPDFSAIGINGSSDADIHNIDAEQFDIKINGSGDVSASGQCKNADYTINGSGDISAETLICDTAFVKISGSGDADIYAESEISVRIAGSGDVTVSGQPMVKKMSVSGSGDFEMRN